MKFRPPMWARTLFVGCAAVSCTSLVQADEFLLDIPPEPQRQTYWCWAAVSTMVGHSFDIRIGGNPLSQLDIVKFARIGIRTETQRTTLPLSAELASSPCSLSNTLCDETGDSWLYGVNGTQLPEDRVIKKSRLIKEIQDRGRPVILKWDYKQETQQGNLPGGEHYVIITGYNPDTDKFRVFDPWPKLTSTSGGNEHWISYDGYLVPKVDLGQEVFAKHPFDVFNLKQGSGKISIARPGNNALMAEPPVMQLTLRPIPFDDLNLVTPTITGLVSHRVVYTRNRIRVTEPLGVGQIYPIVVLTTRQLMDTRDRPDSLLAARTSSVIATVVKAASGEVVDSLLVYNDAGTWKEAEYSNTLITRHMDAVRSRHPVHGNNPSQSYYLVSIPEQAAFYAARGFGGSALLASLDDANGDLVPAHEALTALIQNVDAASRRMADRAAAQPHSPGSSHESR